jgi:phosphoserine phosphatase RsbU/P
LHDLIRPICSRLRSLGAIPSVAVAAACLCVALACPAQGQTFDATNLRAPADLGVKWRVHGGDDPAYARPDFDDSQWTLFDPYTTITRIFPGTKPDVIWYRLRVKVSPDQSGLALREVSISRAFEIYVNGERLIASGRVAPFVPYTLNARLLKRIPDRQLATGSLVIAMRVHVSQTEWAHGQAPGFYAYNLALGQEHTLYQDDWLGVIGDNALNWFDNSLLFGLGIVALVLFSAQRRQSEYLWIVALAAVKFPQFLFNAVSSFYDIPVAWQVASGSLMIATPLIIVSLYFGFVRLHIGWKFRTFLVVAGLLNAYSGLQSLFGTLPEYAQFFINIPFVVLLSAVIPVVLAMHWRRGNHEAGILLIPNVLFSLYVYALVALLTLYQFPAWRPTAIRGVTLIDRFPAGPFLISLDTVSAILSTVALAIIMLLRFTRMTREQAHLESEVAAAREVQQVILPEQGDSVPGFSVESIYQPAQQVGGDFFQVLPAPNGGLLLVVGDVAGKGLPAAMMVSVLVGAIRGVAEFTTDPSELLANLNDRLIGRTQGSFSTALAAHIAADGLVTIANAGHLSPYLDGREIELTGALPLGIHPHARYESSQFHLAPGSRLTFYSDGVIEARNQQGELFGFDRGKAISTQPAAAIVEAAKQFGQEDDITVVAIARHPAIASAA